MRRRRGNPSSTGSKFGEEFGGVIEFSFRGIAFNIPMFGKGRSNDDSD
jgi:hypothetical protein